jgi:Zn ribbon nucleic-acid-binding protein
MADNEKDVIMAATKVPTTYVRPDNTAVITCPHCGRQKTLQALSFKGHKHKLKVKCGCDKVFTANLEFRKKVRKNVNLRGNYINHSQKDKTGNIVVRNISLGGLEFTCYDIHDFKVDDELTLTFTLHDEHMSEISKGAVVKDIRPNSIGCEFDRSGDYAYDGPLGYFIMS